MRKLRKYKKRIETGPIKFGDDHCGIFIRGDNALWYAFVLKQFLEKNKDNNDLDHLTLYGLMNTLSSCFEGAEANLINKK